MADGGKRIGERKVLKGGRVAIEGKVYHHEFLCEWVGKTVEISIVEMMPGLRFYQAQPDGEELFFPLSESKLQQDRESGEVQAERDEAIDEVREILEKFKEDNPGQDHLVLDIIESAGKLVFPGYSVQIITSPVGTGRW